MYSSLISVVTVFSVVSNTVNSLSAQKDLTATAAQPATNGTAADWPGIDVLTDGADIEIPLGKTMQIPSKGIIKIGKIVVKGRLICPQGGETEVNTNGILVSGGEFLCTGSKDSSVSVSSNNSTNSSSAYPGKLKITLSGNSTIIVENSGKLVLAGSGDKSSWDRLMDTAPKGAKSIIVPASTKWETGDEIAIAPTDYKFDSYEVFKIESSRPGIEPDSLELSLNGTLKFTHFGKDQKVEDKVLKSRGEVALLSRNIKIYGDEENFRTAKLGVSIGVVKNSTAQIDNIEIRNAGHFNIFAKYPVHFGNLQNSNGNFVKRTSVYKSINRCFSIVCTDNVLLEDNSCTDHVGHGYFLGAGFENNNMLKHNLGITSREGTGEIMPSDKVLNDRTGVATFWATNPNNSFVDNAAAGSEWFGFSLEFTKEVFEKQKQMAVCPDRAALVPDLGAVSNIKLQELTGMVVHSTNSSAFWFGDGYFPKEPVIMSGLHAFKVGTKGNFPSCFFPHGNHMMFKNSSCADFRRALWFVFHNTMVDSLIIGLSENRGDPSTDVEIKANRTLPNGIETEFAAHHCYDGPSAIYNTIFAHFNSEPESGLKGLHFDIFGGAHSAINNFMTGIKMIERNGDKTPKIKASIGAAMLIDLDGSVTGMPNSYIAPLKYGNFMDKPIEMPGPGFADAECKPFPEKEPTCVVCPKMDMNGLLYVKPTNGAVTDSMKVTDTKSPALVQEYPIRNVPDFLSFEIPVRKGRPYRMEYSGNRIGCLKFYIRSGGNVTDVFLFDIVGEFKDVKANGGPIPVVTSAQELAGAAKASMLKGPGITQLALPTSNKQPLLDQSGNNAGNGDSDFVDICF